MARRTSPRPGDRPGERVIGALDRGALDLARAAFFDGLYRGKTVLCIGFSDERAVEVMARRGAAKVTAVHPDHKIVDSARHRLASLGARVELRVGRVAEVVRGRFDVVALERAEYLVSQSDLVETLLERLAPGGFLVAAARNGDVEVEPPGDEEGGSVPPPIGYFELLDALAPHFPSVTMLGQRAFRGVTLSPFGEDAADPVLDAALAAYDDPAELYVAVAGPRALDLPFGVVALPAEESLALLAHTGDEILRTLAETRARLLASEAERARLAEEMERRAQSGAQAIEEVTAALRNKESRVRELEAERARAEGSPTSPAAASEPSAEGGGRLAELTLEVEKLKAKAADAQREAWAHMKARSDAEAAAAEVREDTVRKLKDARKLANVELTRAMEEATKKAVTLKEELVRTERELKEALRAAESARAELIQERGAIDEKVHAASAAASSAALASLEARVLAAESERDRAPAPGAVMAELDRIGTELSSEARRLAAIEEGLRRASADLEPAGAAVARVE